MMLKVADAVGEKKMKTIAVVPHQMSWSQKGAKRDLEVLLLLILTEPKNQTVNSQALW